MSYENSSQPFPVMLPDQETGLHLITQLCVLPQRCNDPGTNAEVVLLQEGGPLPGPEKKNTFESVLMRWMKLEPIIQSEVSQKEKHKYSILMHIYGI